MQIDKTHITKMIEMKEAKLSNRTIANGIGCSVQTVAKYLTKFLPGYGQEGYNNEGRPKVYKTPMKICRFSVDAKIELTGSQVRSKLWNIFSNLQEASPHLLSLVDCKFIQQVLNPSQPLEEE